MEQKNITKDDMRLLSARLEEKENEVQQLSLQQVDIINQLDVANQEVINLRTENVRLQNNLNTKKKTKERMLNSQERMNLLIQKTQFRHHGKTGLGYIDQSESSHQGAQKNNKPTCNHCGKLGHTSNKWWRKGKSKFNGKCYSCNKNRHKVSECIEKPKFKENSLSVTNKVTNHQNVEPRNGALLKNQLK